MVAVVPLLLVSAAACGPGPATDAGRRETTSASATSTAATSTVSVPIPDNLTGKSLPDVRAELARLGFRDIVVQSVDGRGIVAESNWQVVSVEGAGTAASTSTRIVVRVDKPQPTRPPTTAYTPAPTRAPEPIPQPEPQPDPAPSAYYANCAEARAAGAAPILRGQPGYRSALDRDGDGVACE